jgi:hypothetical protein
MSRTIIAFPFGTTRDKSSKEWGQMKSETDFVNFMENVISRVDERWAYTSALEKDEDRVLQSLEQELMVVESLEQELVYWEATPARLVAQRATYLRTLKQEIRKAADDAVLQMGNLVSRAGTLTLQRIRSMSTGTQTLLRKSTIGTQTLLKRAQPLVEALSTSLFTETQPVLSAQPFPRTLASVFATLIAGTCSLFALVRAHVLAAAAGLMSFAVAGVDKLRILVDSEYRERLEAEEAKRAMLEEQARRHRNNAERWEMAKRACHQSAQTVTRYVGGKTSEMGKLMGGSLLDSLEGASELSDVVLLVEDELFSAHGLVLAARSKYFRGLLLSGMQEGNRQHEVLASFCPRSKPSASTHQGTQHTGHGTSETKERPTIHAKETYYRDQRDPPKNHTAYKLWHKARYNPAQATLTQKGIGDFVPSCLEKAAITRMISS